MKSSYLKLSTILAGFFATLICFGALADEKSSSPLVELLHQLETDLNNRDSASLTKTINADALLNRAFQGIETDERFVVGFKKGARQGVGKLSQKLIDNMNDESTVKLTKYEDNPVGKLSSGLFRFNYGEEGMAYIRFYVDKTENNLTIVDWFEFTRGQTASNSLSMVIRAIAPSKGIIGKIKDFGSDKDRVAQMYMEFSKHFRAGNIQGMKNMFEQSGEQMQQRWEIMSGLAVVSAASGDEDFYMAVSKSLDKNFSQNAKAGFLLIDYYFLTEQYNKVLRILDVLATNIGAKDAGLLQLKANTYYVMKEYKRANETALKCIEAESDYEDCYWVLVNTALDEKDHNEVVNQLKALENQFGYVFDKQGLEESEGYEEFVKSIAFEQWLGSNAANVEGTSIQ